MEMMEPGEKMSEVDQRGEGGEGRVAPGSCSKDTFLTYNLQAVRQLAID
jgi:hypothetical protein